MAMPLTVPVACLDGAGKGSSLVPVDSIIFSQGFDVYLRKQVAGGVAQGNMCMALM